MNERDAHIGLLWWETVHVGIVGSRWLDGDYTEHDDSTFQTVHEDIVETRYDRAFHTEHNDGTFRAMPDTFISWDKLFHHDDVCYIVILDPLIYLWRTLSTVFDIDLVQDLLCNVYHATQLAFNDWLYALPPWSTWEREFIYRSHLTDHLYGIQMAKYGVGWWGKNLIDWVEFFTS